MSPSGSGLLDVASACAIARRVFTAGPLLLRTLQHHRPRICPFGAVLAEIPTGSAILDVGCGGGLLLALAGATRAPTRLVGFDASPAAVGLALANLARFDGPKPEIAVVPVGGAWPTGPFRVVTLCDVLHHVPRPAWEDLLGRVAAALGPGGRLVYKDVYPEGVFRPTMSRLHDLVLARQRITIPRLDEVAGVLSGLGLRERSRRRIDVLWYGHELAVFEKH